MQVSSYQATLVALLKPRLFSKITLLTLSMASKVVMVQSFTQISMQANHHALEEVTSQPTSVTNKELTPIWELIRSNSPI